MLVARELIVGALARGLVVAPAAQLGAVADAPRADVVEVHLHHQLGTQADPLEIAPGAPAAGLARAALARLIAGAKRLHQPAFLRRGQARAVADHAQVAHRRRGRGSGRPPCSAPCPGRQPTTTVSIVRTRLTLTMPRPLARRDRGHRAAWRSPPRRPRARRRARSAVATVAISSIGAASKPSRSVSDSSASRRCEKGPLHQDDVVVGCKEVERDQHGRRLLRESRDRARPPDGCAARARRSPRARRRRARRSRRRGHIAAPAGRRRRRGSNGPAAYRYVTAGNALVAIHERDTAEAVELDLVDPLVALGEGPARQRELQAGSAEPAGALMRSHRTRRAVCERSRRPCAQSSDLCAHGSAARAWARLSACAKCGGHGASPRPSCSWRAASSNSPSSRAAQLVNLGGMRVAMSARSSAGTVASVNAAGIAAGESLPRQRASTPAHRAARAPRTRSRSCNRARSRCNRGTRRGVLPSTTCSSRSSARAARPRARARARHAARDRTASAGSMRTQMCTPREPEVAGPTDGGRDRPAPRARPPAPQPRSNYGHSTPGTGSRSMRSSSGWSMSSRRTGCGLRSNAAEVDHPRELRGIGGQA